MLTVLAHRHALSVAPHQARTATVVWMKRSFALATLAAILLVSTAASAGASTVTPGTWAPKFCGALSTFQQDLSSQGTQADAVLSGNITSLTQAKTTLATFMSRAVKDADTALTSLKKAGTPNVPNGSKIAGQFTSAFQNARSLFASAKTQAQRLPTKTLSGFESSTKKVTANLNKGAQGLTAKFANIQKLDTSGKVAAALQAEPTCAFLQGSSQSSQSTTTTLP
jgi:hypothetical protein